MIGCLSPLTVNDDSKPFRIEQGVSDAIPQDYWARAQFVDINDEVSLRSQHNIRALALAVDRAHDEMVFGQQQFVAFSEIASNQQPYDFLGPVAAHNAIGVDSVRLRDRLPQ